MAAAPTTPWVNAALVAGNGNGGEREEDDKISNSSSQHNVQTLGVAAAAEHAAADGLPLHLSLLLGSHN